MLMPIRKLFSLKNWHHSSSSSVPLVCMVFSKLMPGRRYFSWNSIALR